MVTYANNLTRPDGQYTAIVTIEGVGHWLSASDLAFTVSEGLTQFSYEVPFYASDTLAIHRPYLADEINILDERVDPSGGFPELGNLSFSVVDVDDYLTGLLRTHRPPYTNLTTAVNGSTTTLVLGTTAALSAADTDGGIIYLGSEAMKIVSVDSGTGATVLRGYLGTRPVAHAANTPVFLSVPYLKGRQVAVKLVPQDADSAAEETALGFYSLDSISWDESLNVWQFQAKGRLKYLHRQAPIRPSHGRVTGVTARPSIHVQELSGRGGIFLQQWSGTEGDPVRRAYLRLGDEIVAVSNVGSRTAVISDRGLLGTQVQDTIEIGTPAHIVFLSNLDNGAGSFRFSPGGSPSTSRASGTWVQTDHWVDLCLCIMTSSAHDADGYEAGNFTGAYGNFACLPAGFGLGLPASLIDWDSWMAVKARTLDFRFPYFVYGDRPQPFGALIEEHFLKPMGAYLTVVNGAARIVLPRLPLANETQLDIGPASILTREVGPLLLEPAQTLTMGMNPTGSVTYEVGPEKVSRTYTNADFDATYGGGGFYDQDEKPTLIPVPSGDPGFADVYKKRAASRLYREHVPTFDIDVDLTMDTSTLNVGDTATYTLDEMPDTANGTRGWALVVVEKLAGEVQVPLDDVAHVKTKLRGYAPGIQARRIAPAAYIDSVSTEIATVLANRFTESDALGGLPTTDAAAFSVDDVVRLVDLDGTDVGGGTQIIVDITGNDIELDGTFGGNLTAGLLLVYAGFDDVTGDQADNYAFMADRATMTRGTAGAPDIYAEV